MGQIFVPRLYPNRIFLALMSSILLSIMFTGGITKSRADDGLTSQGTQAGPKVDLDILNANLLSVVRALRLQSGAQIVVVGGDKNYHTVTLTVTGSLSSVLHYVAESAGATVTQNTDGVYVLRPQSDQDAAAAVDADAAAPTAQQISDAAYVPAAAPRGPLHWERIKMQYVSPQFILIMLDIKDGYRDTDPRDQMPATPDAVSFQQPKSFNVSGNSPKVDSTEETQNEQPGVPMSGDSYGSNNTNTANRASYGRGDQAQQFVPPFQQQGGGGFPGQNNGGGGFPGQNGGGGAAGATPIKNLKPEGVTSIISNQQDNSLLVQGDAEGIQELRQIIQLLDIPAKQVQIKAEFITASVTVVDQFGINFQLIPSPNLNGTFSGNSSTGTTVVNFAQGNLVAQLQAQLSRDEGQVVSSPLVTTTNNTQATIRFNEEIPFVQSTTNVNGSGTAVQSQGVGELDVNSYLSVTPRINGDNSVTMTLQLPNTVVNPSSDASLPPSTTTQEVDTTRTVANGETMVLGGLVSKNDSHVRVSVPILGSIPILGNLFRTRNVNVADTELLIFITPTVLPYPGDNNVTTTADTNGVGVTP